MTRQYLNTVASIFIRAFLLCVGFQLLVLGMVLGLHDWAYSWHGWLFGLSVEAFDLMSYGFLGLMKVLGLVLFLIPWAAVKMVARTLPE